jgi:hypothetical protein
MALISCAQANRFRLGVAVRTLKHKKQNERKGMNDKFDELAKSMAQSVTRRTALKRFGIGIGLIALAALGLANNAHAAKAGAKLGGLGDPCPCKKGLVCRPYGLLGGRCTRPGGIGI